MVWRQGKAVIIRRASRRIFFLGLKSFCSSLPSMNPSALPETGTGYRWIESEHPDLSFYNVPRYFPWPVEEPETIDLKKDFPFDIMLRAVPRLPLEKNWRYAIWKH